MGIEQIVDVVITRETRVPTQAGFGTPLVWTTEPTFSNVRSYTSLSAVLADFATTTEVYKKAAFLFSQDLAPESIKVAKRPNVGTIESELQAVIDKDNDWYFLLTDLTVDPSLDTPVDDESDILDLAAFIEGLGATNPKLFGVLLRDGDIDDAASTTDVANLLKELAYDRTITFFVKPNVAQTYTIEFSVDLITANQIDGKINGIAITPVVYAVSHANTMSLLETEVELSPSVLSATVASKTLTVVMKEDTDIVLADWAVTLGASQPTTTVTETVEPDWTRKGNRNIAAWAGGQLPEDPGSITWKFKEQKGCITDEFTDTERTAIRAKNCNYYETIGGLGIAAEGVVTSGEFIDVIRGLDFIKARMQENVFGAIASAKKIPYTDDGVNIISAYIQQTLDLGVSRSIFAANPAPVLVAGAVSSQSTADRAARYFDDFDWSATLAGAIHKTKITGKVSV